MSDEPTFTEELRITTTKPTAAEAVAAAEELLLAGGYEPAWLSVSKCHMTGDWSAMFAGKRPAAVRVRETTR